MRKNLVIVLAIAVLGLLGAYGLSQRDRTPSSSAAGSSAQNSSYRDGTHKGEVAETPYGDVQIEVVIKDRRIVDVKYLKMPNGDERSREITGFSSPALKQNTLKAQGSNIDFVSGATSTSYGYQQSLQAALDKAAGAALLMRNSKNS